MKKTEKLYTERASFYERFFVGFLGWGRELEAFFQGAEYLRANFKILDAGCGTGIITRVLYQRANEKGYEGIKFHAFDLTQNMLGIFQEWITGQAADNIELQRADVLELESLPPHWKGYDLIVSSTMLEYLPKDKSKDALYNLKQLLGSNGTFLVIITKRNFLTQWLAGKWWKTNLYDEREIRALFHAVDFNKIDFKKFSPRWLNFIMVIEAKK
jgi:SAM-dependent methyltransferase